MTPSQKSTDHPKINGSIPGQLDSTQPSRVLRQPHSTLLFAAFDPRTASAQVGPNFRKLFPQDESNRPRPKRIVVETTPSGASFWRFVPNAQKEEGVSDEGQWPRVVMICGNRIECSQDQWDIYKLDPSYNCCVRAAPYLSTIIHVDIPPADSEAPSTPSKKRHASPLERDNPPLSPHPQERATKRASSPNMSSDDRDEADVERMVIDEDEQDEADVEEMVIDEDEHIEPERMIIDEDERPNMRKSGFRAKKYKERMEQNRRERRERTKRRVEKLDGNRSNFNPLVSPMPPSYAGEKRKVSELFESLREQEDPNYRSYPKSGPSHTTGLFGSDHPKPPKQSRAISPDYRKPNSKIRHRERERRKTQKLREDLHDRRQHMDNQFMEEVYSEAQACFESSNGSSTPLDGDPNKKDGNDDSEDSGRSDAARLAESLRKMAELERDKPLWDEAKRQREMREEAEQEALRAKAKQRKQEEEAQRAEAERRSRAQREEHAKAETRERRQRESRWAGPWSSQRALDRYRTLCQVFDTKKYTVDEPLSFDLVPWPSLRAPSALSVEDIDWAAVEEFFGTMQRHVRGQEYKDFVVQSHRRFHPDRWRSRGLLKTVVDDKERGFMEVALNTVAQALTPIWQELNR